MLNLGSSNQNVLAQIVKHKQKEVADRKLNTPIANLQKDLSGSSRSLKAALSNEHSDFILECKKASPSKGLIRANFDIHEILTHYKDFASAISVLTDDRYFQGEFEFLKIASKTVQQPILCKDFFIDPYQVYEARYYGADAILLMLSVLDDETYRQLSDIAEELKLDVLTEVHDTNELERALKLDAQIIGINNRDLKTLKIDLATTEQLANKVNNGAIIISESGIETHEDITRLAPLVGGFLIGSSIMAKHDIRTHCKSLLFGNVKICGLTKPEDAIAVDSAGGVYGGFIFHPNSKRYVDFEKAKQIRQHAPLKYIGVFVNEDLDLVMKYATELCLFAIQLHGDETAEYIAELKARLNKSYSKHVQIWKAERINREISFLPNTDVDRYLLDTYVDNEYGGSGKSFDWSLLKDFQSNSVILAGGINIQNAKEALNQNIFGIDLSSGVESEPGVKDPHKIDALFKDVRV